MLLGVVPSQDLRWENGELEPRANDVIRFAEACNASPRDLVADLAEPVTQQLCLPFEIDPEARRVARHLVELLRERPRIRPARTKTLGLASGRGVGATGNIRLFQPGRSSWTHPSKHLPILLLPDL